MVRSGFLYLLVIVIAATSQTSCSRLYVLNEKELSHVPYRGNELLVFQSDNKSVDSFRLGSPVRDTHSVLIHSKVRKMERYTIFNNADESARRNAEHKNTD